MTRGATLPELLAALAIAGLLLALAVPPAGAARDRALVLLHARALAAAHADTRLTARRAGARHELVVTPQAYQQRTLTGQLVWSRPGPAEAGIILTGPSTPIVFDSRGYTLGAANRTWQLTRGRSSVRVVVSRLGRLRVLP